TLVAGNNPSGIGIWGSALTLTNTTVAGNGASPGSNVPNGIVVVDPATDTVTITNSIVSGNSGNDLVGNTNQQNVNAGAAISYSIVGTGMFTPGTATFSSSPQFVDAANGNYRLQAASPGINTGKNAAVPPTLTMDLDGNARTVSGYVDMGPYEDQNAADGVQHQAPTATPQTLTTNINTALPITLSATNPNGFALTFQIQSGLAPGTGTLSG